MFLLLAGAPSAFASQWVSIPGGSYVTFFSKDRKPTRVAGFEMQRFPVTKEQFQHFLRRNPGWSQTGMKRLFADEHYLSDWNKLKAQAPATHISWFAARAYCKYAGADLPTTDQWEYVAYDHGKGPEEINEWYSHPNPPIVPEISRATRNGFGVYGIYDLVWEWTLDFDEGTTDSEEQANTCGGASIGAINKTDYAAFMRYSFRSSLKANYTEKDLGFRCARAPRGNKE